MYTVGKTRILATLNFLFACNAAQFWLSRSQNIHTFKDLWEQCPRSDWLLWLIPRLLMGYKQYPILRGTQNRALLVEWGQQFIREFVIPEQGEIPDVLQAILGEVDNPIKVWPDLLYSAGSQRACHALMSACTEDDFYIWWHISMIHGSCYADHTPQGREYLARGVEHVRRIVPFELMERAWEALEDEVCGPLMKTDGTTTGRLPSSESSMVNFPKVGFSG